VEPDYECSAYAQLRKTLLDDRLSLSAIGRLDGFSDFAPRFSPRFSAVYTLGAERQHNLRANYAQAYRAPALLDRYIRLDIGRVLLIGNANGGFEQLPLDFQTAGAQPSTIGQLRLERVQGFEVGYKGFLTERLLADVSYYRNRYADFVGTRRFLGRESGGTPEPLQLAAPPAPGAPGFADRTRVLQTWVNAEQEVTTQGVTVGAEYNAVLPLRLQANYTWSGITEVEGLTLGFNTPDHKVSVGATGQLYGRVRYSTNVRTVSSYFYSMPFAEGTIDAHTVVDVQLGHQLPRFGAEVYGGVANLFDADNVTAYGSAPMGRLVFLCLRYTPVGAIR
jgi:outer membrane cobalamin receptor